MTGDHTAINPSTRPVLLTASFWADTFERVVTAVASVALALLGTNLTDPSQIDWPSLFWTVLFTAVIRVLLCIIARSTGDKTVPNASFFLTSGKKVT